MNIFNSVKKAEIHVHLEATITPDLCKKFAKRNNYEIPEDRSKSLEFLKKSIMNLKKCDLKKNAKNIVFSDGNPKSKIMLIGEAPGANEDDEGLPFVGRAGMLSLIHI